MLETDFNDWMVDVDRRVRAMTGLSVSDLPDVDFYGYWEDGESARKTARDIVAENKAELGW